MTDDPVLAAVQRFMDAVETRLGTLTGETRSLLTDARTALAELQTRAATSGPQGLPGERGEIGPAGHAVSVTVSPDAPVERKAGDLWIIP